MSSWRLAFPVAVAWAATAVLVGLPGLLAAASCVLWLGCVVVLVVARFRPRRVIAWVALALAVAALVVSVAAFRSPARQPSDLVRAASDGRRVVATVVLGEDAIPGKPADGTITFFSLGGVTRSATVPVTVFPPLGGGVRAPLGSTIEVAGQLVESDPGDQVAFRLFAAGAVTVRAGPAWYLSWAKQLRRTFGQSSYDLSGDGGALLPGLAIGDTSTVSDSLDAAMKATSLSHLTAVSGANCVVVIGLVMLGGARLRLPRALRVGLASTVLLGFVVLVTPQPSVLRAAVMAGIVLVTLATGRPMSGLPVLSLATLVLLVSDPWLSRSYGFVLSVLATAGLLLIARPLSARLSLWMPPWLATVIAVPLAAQLACQPVLLLLNPTIPTYGVFANLLAEPAAPLATVLGLAACLLLPTVPILGNVVLNIAWLPSAWIAGVARFFAGLPGSSIPWPGGLVGVVLCAAIIALGLLVALKPGGRRVRRLAVASLSLLLVTLIAVTVGDRVRTTLLRPHDWQIAACDIGQGDSVLVRSIGKVALIDTGPKPDRLAHCLDELGITHIDLLILSHYDLDHVGGTSAVFGKVTRATIGPSSDPNDVVLAENLAANGAAVEHVSQGLTGILGELRWQVLWPKAQLGGVQPGNDASVTVRFSGAGTCAAGCLSSIFLGDLGEQPQGLVLAANPDIGHVDVVKVAHHGSADQNERMYQKLTADVGLISVGLGNDYGHPTDRLLGILARAGTLAFRTDYEGMTLVTPIPGGGETVWTERSMPSSKLLHH